MMTLSNMVKTTTVELDGDYVMDMYAESVTMSTYLLAFVICDFKKVTKQTPTNNISVSVIAAPGKIDQTDFALEAAVNITDFYEEYLGPIDD